MTHLTSDILIGSNNGCSARRQTSARKEELVILSSARGVDMSKCHLSYIGGGDQDVEHETKCWHTLSSVGGVWLRD